MRTSGATNRHQSSSRCKRERTEWASQQFRPSGARHELRRHTTGSTHVHCRKFCTFPEGSPKAHQLHPKKALNEYQEHTKYTLVVPPEAL